MTDRLYLRDAYEKTFGATVLDLGPDGAVLLDRTCFYPGGGGQPADTGTLSGDGWSAVVERLEATPNGVWHHVAGAALRVGDQVRGAIDWGRRYQLMRTHTALHVLCGVLWKTHRGLSTGCNMKLDGATIDFDLESLDASLATSIEEMVNAEIAAARPIVVSVVQRRVADAMPNLVRTKTNLPAGPPHRDQTGRHHRSRRSS